MGGLGGSDKNDDRIGRVVDFVTYGNIRANLCVAGEMICRSDLAPSYTRGVHIISRVYLFHDPLIQQIPWKLQATKTLSFTWDGGMAAI
jgi:hypothetical protein